MKAFTTGVNAVLKNKTAQTIDENKQAMARNVASDKLAQKNMDATKARGKVNQEVKSKLIW